MSPFFTKIRTWLLHLDSTELHVFNAELTTHGNDVRGSEGQRVLASDPTEGMAANITQVMVKIQCQLRPLAVCAKFSSSERRGNADAVKFFLHWPHLQTSRGWKTMILLNSQGPNIQVWLCEIFVVVFA